ncbi:IPT/TIG domain-containing protein [Candidatus Amarobacter glycogenicus]|uniref:IPT/TIG domain-containing protein n=1 Tax=Candidatus Amarobacter glycogenicus TaxID=3140699 RepID=UPI00313671B1|nr:IPT/TIG domain-containing protein [Dehalococcoidia bacterium]
MILSDASNGGSVGPASTVTIADNDGPGTVHFSSTTYTANETGGTASFAVTRINGSAGTRSATCSTVDLASATPGLDYTATPVTSSLNWADGDTSTQYCQVAILPDGVPEGLETFGLSLTGDVSSPTSATVTIIDDDGTGTLQFSATTYTGAESGGAITVVVTRTGGTSGTVTVDISTSSSGSTAGADVDYVADSGLLTFVNGDSSETWTIMPIDDAIVEGTEHFHVVLSNPSGGAVLGSPSTAQVNITDNESPLPSITDITPASGTILGGTVVTIYGVNFTGATSVTFGGYACTSLIVLTANTITCVTPAHVAGTVDVVVTTPAGSNSTTGTANDYTYTGGPTITSLSPDTGLANGTTVVTITGTGFTASGTVVRFDGIVAIHSFVDSEMLVAVAPAHSAGVVDVSVTTPGGTSPNTIADDFTYTGASVPVVTLLSPASGPIGTTVTIAGSGLTGATLVTFGGVAATFTVNSDAQITASVPSATPIGTVDVRVSTPSGTSANTAADNFNNTSSATTVTYTLFFRFTLIVWTGQNNIGALAALKGLENPDNPNTNNVLAFIGAIWRFDAATQTFKAYFPGSDGVPGANDFTTLQSGVGYFIALLNPGTVTWTTLGAQ